MKKKIVSEKKVKTIINKNNVDKNKVKKYQKMDLGSIIQKEFDVEDLNKDSVIIKKVGTLEFKTKQWKEGDIIEFNMRQAIQGDKTLVALLNIKDKEPEFYNALSEAILHLNDTYKDKYEATKSFVDTKQILYDPEKGKYVSLYQAMRYIQRLFAPGDKYDKGENKKDILKAIHYLLFHTVMFNRKQNVKNVDLKG